MTWHPASLLYVLRKPQFLLPCRRLRISSTRLVQRAFASGNGEAQKANATSNNQNKPEKDASKPSGSLPQDTPTVRSAQPTMNASASSGGASNAPDSGTQAQDADKSTARPAEAQVVPSQTSSSSAGSKPDDKHISGGDTPSNSAENDLQAKLKQVAGASRTIASASQTIKQNEKSQSPISWVSVLIAGGVGGWLLYYYQKAKEQKHSQARVDIKTVGTPKLGGPFELTDSYGRPVTDKSFLGRYIMLYFGFTNCPDICPTELHKMERALNIYETFPDVRDLQQLGQVIPVFISVDPKRDTPARMQAYAKDFHPRTVWLTGTDEQLSRVAKSYRMYYSKPPANTDDYQVDHSIFFFLIGPDGKFLEYFGKNLTSEEVAAKMRVTVMNDKNQRALRGEWPPKTTTGDAADNNTSTQQKAP